MHREVGLRQLAMQRHVTLCSLLKPLQRCSGACVHLISLHPPIFEKYIVHKHDYILFLAHLAGHWGYSKTWNVMSVR